MSKKVRLHVSTIQIRILSITYLYTSTQEQRWNDPEEMSDTIWMFLVKYV